MLNNKQNIDAWSKNSKDLKAEFYQNYQSSGDFWHQELINPHILASLGNVQDLKILDAGCGEGYFSRILAKMGAIVTGLEPSALLDYAVRYEKQEPLGIEYLSADLCEFQQKCNFDAIVAINVFMDIPEAQLAVVKCAENLKQGGKLIFSILHPCFLFLNRSSEEFYKISEMDYFTEKQLKQSNDVITHRQLSTYVNYTTNAGFKITKVIEPQLDPKHKQSACNFPLFLIIEAVKV